MEVKQGRRLKIAVHAFLGLPYFLTRDFILHVKLLQLIQKASGSFA